MSLEAPPSPLSLSHSPSLALSFPFFFLFESGEKERGKAILGMNNPQNEWENIWDHFRICHSNFGIPCEVSAGLAAAIGEAADFTAKAHARSAALAGRRTSTAPVDSAACSLFFIITCYSEKQSNNCSSCSTIQFSNTKLQKKAITYISCVSKQIN